MGLLNKLFGYRWSLYIVRNKKELVYAMHENSVYRIIGYVQGSFASGSKPVPPWSLHLNFNKEHKSFELQPEHFTPDGKNITELLAQQIDAIDPNCGVPGHEPIFVEAATKKRIKISDLIDHHTVESLEEAIRNADKPRVLTFFDVMDVVFGKTNS